MCYSAQSSIQNYIVVLSVCSVLYALGDNFDKHIALFFFVVIQMQIAEYFMWIDQQCKTTNTMATYYAYVVLALQPLSVLWGGYFFKSLSISFNATMLITVIYLLPIVKAFMDYTNTTIKPCSKSINGHLRWDFWHHNYNLDSVLYIILMLLPWLLMKNIRKGVFVFLLLFSSMIYHYVYHPEHWGSLWCYIIRNVVLLYTAVTLGPMYLT